MMVGIDATKNLLERQESKHTIIHQGSSFLERDESNYLSNPNISADYSREYFDVAASAMQPTQGLASPAPVEDFTQNQLGLVVKHAMQTKSKSEQELIELIQSENGKLQEKAQRI